jgi:hypothetical protein
MLCVDCQRATDNAVRLLSGGPFKALVNVIVHYYCGSRRGVSNGFIVLGEGQTLADTQSIK